MFDFSTFPVLETQRLTLRALVDTDAAAVWAIRGDYEVTKYNTGAPIRTPIEAALIIQAINADYREKIAVRWGIARKDNDAVIGMCGFNYWDRANFRASVGYDLARAYWGQGLMPEALRRVVRFGFEEMGLNRIEADSSALNTASARVLEKVGFRQEGLQREQYYEEGQFYDLMLFALLKREFAQR
ncbi:MAG: GNAT family N-acetyltransferase [Chloroflexi bacterium]|nr:GNAT family N-acetyltransferase [Chloroflexota bacterium]